MPEPCRGDTHATRLPLQSSSYRLQHQRPREQVWQRGYGSFSVSATNLAAVTKYIETQEEHHKKWSFQQEFLSLLKKHNVRFDAEHVSIRVSPAKAGFDYFFAAVLGLTA